MKDDGKILVSTDFSEAANNATVYAVNLAEEIEKELLILHVRKEEEDMKMIQEKFEKLEHDFLHGRKVSCSFDTRQGGFWIPSTK